MSEPEKPEPRGTSALIERIRNRREALGLSGIDLARRAEISPSYVSLIERGLKVPNEDVAARLARALADDEELYRAWARAERYGIDRLDELQRLEQFTGDAQASRLLASGRNLPPAAALSPPRSPRRFRIPDVERTPEVLPPAAPAEEPSSAYEPLPEAEELSLDEEPVEPEGDRVVEVPVLPAGADPRQLLDGSPLPPLHLDARLLGVGSRAGLFAYELDRDGAARIGDLASAGDYVVVSRRVRRLSADRVYAVRGEDGGIRLARVLFKGNSLLLLPPSGSSDIGVVPLCEGESWRERVVGVVVLTLKRWG